MIVRYQKNKDYRILDTHYYFTLFFHSCQEFFKNSNHFLKKEASKNLFFVFSKV